MLSLLKTGCALAVVAAAGVCVAGPPLSFTGVGTLPGSVTSRVTAISPDGQVVGAAAGTAGGNPAAFLYVVGSGQRLAVQNGATSVLGLSANGGRAVGVAGTRGYTFDAPAGPFALPYPTSGSIAGISANGNVTAGWYEGFGAFRKTGADDPFSLESLSGFPDMTVSGCSGDGRVVVGTAGRIEPGDPDLGTPDLLYFEAAKVVDEGAWVSLGVLPGVVPITPTESYANGVSADGSTVVGTSLVSRAIPDSTDIAYIYTAFKHQGGAMMPLLSQAGELGFGEALDATADGSVVVGSGDGGSSATGSSATMWVGTSPQDVRDMLVAILTAAGRSTSALDNWSLTACTAISDDGAWLAGDGLFMGVAQGWVAHIVEEPAFVMNPPSVVGVVLGGTLALSVEASGTPAPTYRWYTGQPGSGTPLSDNGGTIVGAATSQLLIHGIAPGDSGSTYYCVATSSLGTATSTVATLVVYTPAFFTSGLPPTTGAVAGTDVTLSLTAAGVPEPTFQWYKGTPGSGTPIGDAPGVASGATTSSLTLINVQASAAGSYYCVAQNIVSSATSTATTLSIIVPPAITMNPPAKVIVRSGDDAQFAVSASGSPAPMFAWSKGEPGSGTNLMDDGTSIEGAQTPTLNLRAVTPDAAGKYYCTAYTFEGYFANSTASRLIVNTGPVITQQPGSQSVSAGGTATFTVAIDGKALGTDDATYAWQKNGAAIDLTADARFTVDHTSGNFATSTLTIGNVIEADAGVYSVLVTGPSGNSQGDDADLTIRTNVPVQITMQPVPLQRKSVGDTATFSVAATGSPPPLYAWLRRTADGDMGLSDGPTPWGSVISGANTNTLTITNLGERVRPNAAAREITGLPGVATGGSPRGFVMLDLSDLVPGPDTLYVLDDGEDVAADDGLYKYAYDGTLSRWVLTGYAPVGAGGAGRLSGLSGLLAPPDSLGLGSPQLVILALTAGDGDVWLFAVDEPVYGSGLDSFMVLDGVSAPTDTKFRGTALVLLPFGPTPMLGLIATRVGDGVAPLSDTGSPVFLDVFGFGTATLPVRSSGPGTKLILDGTAPDEGQLTVSPDGRFIALAGYNAEVGGVDPLAATGASTVPRSVAVLDLLDGGLNVSTSLPDFADQGHPRGAATDDGVNLWLVGSTGGLQYTTVGSNSSILLTAASPTDLRAVAIFGDQLHVAAVFDPVPRGTHGPTGAPPAEPIRIGSVDPAPPLGSDFAQYVCEVFNSAGPTQVSNTAVLENADTPEVQQGPQDVIAPAGTAASFTVALSSDEDGTDCTYNWFRNGVPIDVGSDPRITINPISGGDSMSVLTIDPVALSDDADYAVQVRRSAGGGRSRLFGASLTVQSSNPCRLDYTPDGSVNSDDLGDFITDYFTDPPVAGPDGYATPCPGNDPPYDTGYKAAFTFEGSPQCFQPNSDNLGDFITEYFSTGNNCGNNGP